MQTATLLRFPSRLVIRAMHTFHIDEGPGHVVAMFFQVLGNGVIDPRGTRDNDGRDDQAEQAVIEDGA